MSLATRWHQHFAPFGELGTGAWINATCISKVAVWSLAYIPPGSWPGKGAWLRSLCLFSAQVPLAGSRLVCRFNSPFIVPITVSLPGEECATEHSCRNCGRTGGPSSLSAPFLLDPPLTPSCFLSVPPALILGGGVSAACVC